MADIERAELLRTWVAALRSGKYEQVRNRLRVGSGFCVLGVLCDASGLGEWRSVDDDTYGSIQALAVPGHGSRIISPPAMLLDDCCFGFHVGRMNDSGVSFREIADAIEAYYPDVFGEKVERGEGVEDAYLGADASALELVEA